MDIYWHHITSFSPSSKVRRWFVSEEGALAKSNLQKFPQHQGIIMALPWDYNIYIYISWVGRIYIYVHNGLVIYIYTELVGYIYI